MGKTHYPRNRGTAQDELYHVSRSDETGGCKSPKEAKKRAFLATMRKIQTVKKQERAQDRLYSDKYRQEHWYSEILPFKIISKRFHLLLNFSRWPLRMAPCEFCFQLGTRYSSPAFQRRL